MERTPPKKLFYDIEVFKHDSLLLICDENLNIVHKSWENHFSCRTLVRENTLVGYNNYYYDDLILTAMLRNWTQSEIKELNDIIIHEKDVQERKKKIPKVSNIIRSLDCFQQIDVSMPSLKLIQANMGINIHETPISFDREEPLTIEERSLIESYCLNDIRSTIQVYNMRKTYFETKKYLVQMANYPDKQQMSRWNTTSISAQIVNPSGQRTFWKNVSFGDFDASILDEYITEDIHKLWTGEIKKVITYDYDNKVEWGIGGLHATIGKGDWNDCIHLDIALT